MDVKRSWSPLDFFFLLASVGALLALCFLVMPERPSLRSLGGFVDDSFIFFRYAEHLADGAGVVWNVNEPPVEGISSLAWLSFLAGGHRLSGLPVPLIALWGGIAFAGLAIVVAWSVTRQLLAREYRAFAVLAPILIATTPVVARHATSGMETAFVMFAYAMLFRCLVDHERATALRAATIGGVSGLFYLVRPDALIVSFLVPLLTFGCAGASRTSLTAIREAAVRSRVLAFVAAFVLAVALVTVSRWLYFGSLVPPPAYIKMGLLSGANPFDGARLVITQWTLLFSYAGCLLLAMAWRLVLNVQWRPLEVGLYLGVGAFAAYQLQVVPIMNFSLRFFTPHLVAIAILTTVACVHIGRRLSVSSQGTVYACIAFVAVQLLGSVGNLYSVKNAREPRAMERAIAHALHEVGPITVAYSEAGILPYYSGQRFVDYAGLNDTFIARNRKTAQWTSREYWKYVSERFGLPDIHFDPLPEYATYAGFTGVPEIEAQYTPLVICGTRLWLLRKSAHFDEMSRALKEAPCS